MSNNSRWVPLRPADPSNSSQTPPSPTSPNSPPVKRRRVGVAVACDCCRRKKRRVSILPQQRVHGLFLTSLKCDGQRPVCGACERRGEECTYQMRRKRGEANHDQVVELIRLLNAMPAFEALRAINSVGDITDGAKILEMLKGNMHGRQRPSDISTARSLTARSSIALELITRHPAMYWGMHPTEFLFSNVSGTHQEQLGRLTRPSSSRRHRLSVTRLELSKYLSSMRL